MTDLIAESYGAQVADAMRAAGASASQPRQGLVKSLPRSTFELSRPLVDWCGIVAAARNITLSELIEDAVWRLVAETDDAVERSAQFVARCAGRTGDRRCFNAATGGNGLCAIHHQQRRNREKRVGQ